MEQTEVECPICRVLRGENKEFKGELCSDCKENEGLQADYQGWLILRSVRNTMLLYGWGWPVMLVGTIWLGWKTGSRIIDVGAVVSSCLWVFNVFWMWPTLGVSKAFWRPWVKIEEEREKMFVAKVKGPKR